MPFSAQAFGGFERKLCYENEKKTCLVIFFGEEETRFLGEPSDGVEEFVYRHDSAAREVHCRDGCA